MSNTPPNPLSLVSIEKDNSVRVAAEGDMLSTNTASLEHNPLEQVLGPGWVTNRVLIDLSRVRYMDSSAIGWLLASQKKIREKGGTIVVHSVPPRVRQVFDLLRVERVVPVAADETAARAILTTLSQAAAQTAETK